MGIAITYINSWLIPSLPALATSAPKIPPPDRSRSHARPHDPRLRFACSGWDVRPLGPVGSCMPLAASIASAS